MSDFFHPPDHFKINDTIEHNGRRLKVDAVFDDGLELTDGEYIHTVEIEQHHVDSIQRDPNVVEEETNPYVFGNLDRGDVFQTKAGRYVKLDDDTAMVIMTGMFDVGQIQGFTPDRNVVVLYSRIFDERERRQAATTNSDS